MVDSMNDERRQVLLDPLAQLALRQVGVRQPDVVGPALHRVEVIDAVQKRARHVADVDVSCA